MMPRWWGSKRAQAPNKRAKSASTRRTTGTTTTTKRASARHLQGQRPVRVDTHDGVDNAPHKPSSNHSSTLLKDQILSLFGTFHRLEDCWITAPPASSLPIEHAKTTAQLCWPGVDTCFLPSSAVCGGFSLLYQQAVSNSFARETKGRRRQVSKADND